jgi:glycosyltransferase involved in cell wall biosynthesis
MSDLVNPMVSVCMITYNHEQYISQAIDSVLMQQCDFHFELVVGEDFSKDSTREICETFAQKYQEIIKLLPSEGNIGMMPNLIRTLLACNGKYIAYCEGDDFWTDPSKLQKQVEYLEKNLNFIACIHNTKKVIEDGREAKGIKDFKYNKDIVQKRDLYYSWPFHLSSLVFRNIKEKIKSWDRNVFSDKGIYIMLANYGEIGCLLESMSVYRVHGNGVSGKKDLLKSLNDQQLLIETLRKSLGLNFFIGYQIMKFRLIEKYAIFHPEIIKKSTIKKLYYWIKLTLITLFYYPSGLKSRLRIAKRLILFSD